MNHVSVLPVELWHEVCAIIQSRIKSKHPHETTAYNKTLQDLTVVSGAMRAAAQPLLFRRFSVSKRTPSERLVGLMQLFDSRPESASWIKRFKLSFSPSEKQPALVSQLFVRMTRLREVTISVPKIPQQMFAHLLTSTTIRHVGYQTDEIPDGFDELAVADIKLSITDLVIQDLERPDNQVLGRHSSNLTSLEVRDIKNMDGTAIASLHSAGMTTLKLYFKTSTTYERDHIMKILEPFKSLRILHITGLFNGTPGALANAADGGPPILPKLRELRADIAFARVLVPLRPVRELFVYYPRQQPIDLQTIAIISGGSKPMGSLRIEGGRLSNAKDLLTQIATHLPALTVLSLRLFNVPTRSVYAYLQDPNSLLPSQLQRFSSHTTGETIGKPSPAHLYKTVSDIHPSLEYMSIQNPEFWTKKGGVQKMQFR